MSKRQPVARCENCIRRIPKWRRDQGRHVCCQACGDELCERIMRAVPDVLKLVPPEPGRSTWRDGRWSRGAPGWWSPPAW